MLIPGANRDTVFIERDGARQGPFQCNFSSGRFNIFVKELDVTEGDKVVRLIPNKEEYYTVTEVNYSKGLSSIQPHYVLSIRKDSALPKTAPQVATTTNHISIHGSTGIQIGDHNIQNLQIAFKEVLASIEGADAPREVKEEARNRLHSFLSHPLVAAAVGAGLPVALGLLS
jgi:hypothetical protein